MSEYERVLKLAQEDPKTALHKVELWVKYHPNHAAGANLLAYIYLQLKKLKAAEKIIEENYHKFPDYLVSKLNYADLCLRKKRLYEIPLIFPSFDLKTLYPEKSEFLISEVRGFNVIMGLYHLKLHKRAEAEKFYVQAVKVDPLHPSVALLEQKLFRFSTLKKFLARIGISC